MQEKQKRSMEKSNTKKALDSDFGKRNPSKTKEKHGFQDQDESLLLKIFANLIHQSTKAGDEIMIFYYNAQK